MQTTTGERTPAQRLRDLRLSKGWNQTYLSVKAKVSVGTISFAERGQRVPSLLVQERVAKALGVNRWDIWPEEDEAA